MSDPLQRIASDDVLGRDVRLGAFINLSGCPPGDGCMIGAFVGDGVMFINNRHPSVAAALPSP